MNENSRNFRDYLAQLCYLKLLEEKRRSSATAWQKEMTATEQKLTARQRQLALEVREELGP